jgi:hypothetical protein
VVTIFLGELSDRSNATRHARHRIASLSFSVEAAGFPLPRRR